MAILIPNPIMCPGCAKKGSLRWDQHKCGECGVRIFKPTDDFVQLKEDAVYSFWIYFSLNSSGFFRGWVHSAHLADHKPNNPDLKSEKPSESYGRVQRHPKVPMPKPIPMGRV